MQHYKYNDASFIMGVSYGSYILQFGHATTLPQQPSRSVPVDDDVIGLCFRLFKHQRPKETW